jgi:peptidoglycan biosynthesis protein MviN/MurJ (putative lipid II flippase)
LPFAARSLASAEGEGALAVFNYAWKLVELPLMLAIQLVATLAFPRVARAVAAGLDQPGTRAPVQAAFGLAFALACAACAGLLLAADVAARLLFGWGRMDPAGLAQVAEWSRIGAWSLLPQAVSAVGLTVLAAQARLRPAALWHALGLAVLLALGSLASSSAAFLMAALCAVLGMVALGVLAAMGGAVRRLLPWASMGAALAALAVVAWLAPWVTQLLPAPAWRLALAVLAALGVLAAAWAAAGPLRQTLRGRGA